MPKTFPGGIHVNDQKSSTLNQPIRLVPEPKIAVVHLNQSPGAANLAQVQVGEKVLVGQCIGLSAELVSGAIHSPYSGTVVAIEPRAHQNGKMESAIIIENDGKQELHPSVKPYPTLFQLTKDEIIQLVRSAGIVGLGGGGFPTHVKLAIPPDKKVDTVILNGAECEPYLTGDFRLMVEQPEKIILGLLAIVKAVDARQAIIAIEDNKPGAEKSLQLAIEFGFARAGFSRDMADIKIKLLKTKYPQGSEKQLIKALAGREVPSRGLPLDVHCVVNNVQTAFAIGHTLETGMPLIERIITVSGSNLKSPANLLVKIGTPIIDLINAGGGFVSNFKKVILGGPMMGIELTNLESPVIKCTGGLIALSEKEIDLTAPSPCIRCAKCVDACPQSLLPNLLGNYARLKRFRAANNFGAQDCIECGCCAYVCPAKINLVQLIKDAKSKWKK